MNNLFKNIKPNPKQIKANRSYGCLWDIRYGDKRKLNRYYRKYGFDITETWSLDYTIMCWLSDNVKGFFRECGNPNDWFDYDEDNNPRNDNNIKSCINAEIKRIKAYQEELHKFTEDIENPVYNKFIEFIIPRLEFLKNNAFSYPADFNNIKEWKNAIAQMIQDFKVKQLSTYFVKYFFSLWT